MLLRLYTRRQCGGGIRRQDGYRCLRQNLSNVQLSCHAVYRGTCDTAACVNRALVGVQAGEGRQEGWVDVEQPSFVMRDKFRRQNPHKPR